MDQTEFERRLGEVCEFTKPEQSERTGHDKKNKGPKKTVKDDENDSLPIKVHAVKNRPSVCDLCGKICSQGQKYERRMLHRNGFEAWRYNCTVCKLVEDPWTGEMTHTFGTAQNVWEKYIRAHKEIKEIERDIKKLGK